MVKQAIGDPFADLDKEAEAASLETPEPSGGQMLFFDFETVPDESRFPVPSDKTGEVVVAEVAAVLEGKVDDVKKSLAVCPFEQIDEFATKEEEREKPRKGVLDAIAAERKRRYSLRDNWVKEGSVNPLWCRIVAAGWAIDDGEIESMTATNDDEERELLRKFWSMLKSCAKRCGYNILNFDDTVLGFRSVLLGVPVPWTINRNKYRNAQAVDLMQLLFPSSKAQKCKDVAKACGIDVPAGDFDGSQVYAAFKAGEIDQIGEYVRSDVHVERELYRKFRPIFSL